MTALLPGEAVDKYTGTGDTGSVEAGAAHVKAREAELPAL
jgi:hypothetical protein